MECLGRDRTKHQVAEVTSLGLVQMTRKRIGTGLLEAFSENCDHCGGRGLILHDEPKESRRRQDDGRGRGQQQHSHDQKADGEAAKKTSRSRVAARDAAGATDEQPEPTTNGDAAQRLAQIAAASATAAHTEDQVAPHAESPESTHGDADRSARTEHAPQVAADSGRGRGARDESQAAAGSGRR